MYIAEKTNPIAAYKIVNQVSSAGINSVITPSPKADNCITVLANLTPRSLEYMLTTIMLPVSATRVIAIMRIDHC